MLNLRASDSLEHCYLTKISWNLGVQVYHVRKIVQLFTLLENLVWSFIASPYKLLGNGDAYFQIALDMQYPRCSLCLELYYLHHCRRVERWLSWFIGWHAANSLSGISSRYFETRPLCDQVIPFCIYLFRI